MGVMCPRGHSIRARPLVPRLRGVSMSPRMQSLPEVGEWVVVSSLPLFMGRVAYSFNRDVYFNAIETHSAGLVDFAEPHLPRLSLLHIERLGAE